MTTLYLEDFQPGQKFGSGRLSFEAARIESFAAEFDPQPFHLDEESARATLFRGLAASGWHTEAMTMRLLVESELQPSGGGLSPRLHRRHHPVFAGQHSICG
jgi:acyl dehydratase